MAGLTLEMIGADFIHRRIAPLHNKGRSAWDFRNAADIMRLRPSLKHNFTVMGHTHFYQRLFQLDVFSDGRVERTGRAAKASKVVKGPLFGLPPGVFPLSNNTCHSSILDMMSVFNEHGLDPSRVRPPARVVQEFFDNLSEGDEHDEPLLVEDTTQE